MSLNRDQLAQVVARQGRVARVVVASCAGSTPREPGAAMLVWAGGQIGTIGGGALEYAAAERARAALTTGDRLDRVSLGPDIGQCCGGAVTLVTEVWDRARLDGMGDVLARPMPGHDGAEMPLKVANRLRAARNGTRPATVEVVQGWLIEPVAPARRVVWIWGAGHVGRAIVDILRPLPDLHLVWLDTAADRFPPIPDGVEQRIAADLAAEADHAPPQAEHLILTYSHALDLDLCHRLLQHGFGRCGLIGSATKWARFRSRLSALGHGAHSIARIDCPIGDPGLGKHPQAIAIGVALAFLHKHETTVSRQEQAG